MQKVINGIIGVLMLAAFVATMMLPIGEPERHALVHCEIVHVMEPWETVYDVAKRYYPQQQEYESLPQYVTAIRLTNGGFKRTYEVGDRIIVPMARLAAQDGQH